MNERSGLPAGARGAGSVAVAPNTGLSATEAAERLARYGPNELPRAAGRPSWH
jgi:Cation transporter/ATPase, N-terminus